MQALTKQTLLFLSSACLAIFFLTSASWGVGLKTHNNAKSGKHWPFQPYAYVKAFTFNFFPHRNVQLRIIQNGRWSKHIHSERRVDQVIGEQVANIVESTKGSYDVSKCPFPRHAFVFFNDQDQPVASVDICFQCGDMFAWPDFDISNEKKYGAWDEQKDAITGGLQDNYDAAMVAYRKLFIKLGMPLEHPSR